MNMRVFRLGMILLATLPSLLPVALACHDNVYIEVKTAVGDVIVCA